MRPLTIIAVVLLVLGMAMLVAASQWRDWFGRAAWTEEKAQARSLAQNKMHGLHHEHVDHAEQKIAETPEQAAEYEAARKELDTLEASFHHADDRLVATSWILQIGGVLAVLGGVGAVLGDKMMDEQAG